MHASLLHADFSSVPFLQASWCSLGWSLIFFCSCHNSRGFSTQPWTASPVVEGPSPWSALNERVWVIRDRLQNDRTLSDRSTPSPNRVVELLEVCLRSTYFSHEEAFYEQREGAAMGSPVSTMVANLYVHRVLQRACPRHRPIEDPPLEEIC